MKKLFYTPIHHDVVDAGIFFLRVATGLLVLTHGIPKLNNLLGPGPVQFGDPIGLGGLPSLILVTFAEVLCSILIMAGLLTRLSAIPLIIDFIVIVFVVKAGQEVSEKELPLFYMIVYISVLLTGPGGFSLDRLIFGGRASRTNQDMQGPGTHHP